MKAGRLRMETSRPKRKKEGVGKETGRPKRKHVKKKTGRPE